MAKESRTAQRTVVVAGVEMVCEQGGQTETNGVHAGTRNPKNNYSEKKYRKKIDFPTPKAGGRLMHHQNKQYALIVPRLLLSMQ